MELDPVLSAAIAVVLSAGCFVLLAWVWAKVLDDPTRPPRRRGIGTVQLVVLSLLLLAGVVTARDLPAQGDAGSLLPLRMATAAALIGALILFDQDLRRRAGDPRSRHRVTGWGAAAFGAVLLAAVLSAAWVGVAAGDATYTVAVLGAVVGLGVLAALAFRLAVAIQRRWERRRIAAGDRRGAPPAPEPATRDDD